MTWSNPPVVATGDFVTANLWNTYLRANEQHLRGLLPDAGGANQVLVSSGATSAAWGTLPDAAMATQKVSRGGDTMTGDLTVSRAGATTTGVLYLGQNSGAKYLFWDGAGFQLNGGPITLGGATTVVGSIATAGGDLTLSRAGATTVGVLYLGQNSGTKFLSWDGTNFNLIGGPLSVPSGIVGAGASVPSGLIAAFASAAAIASGWARYTAADGRILIGAGTTFSTTFSEGGSYGSSWSHNHTEPNHAHGAAALGVSGTTDQSSGANTAIKGITPGETSAASTTHTHTQGSLDVTGTTDTAAPTTNNTAWLPAMLAIVHAQKA